jgi:hypothetical protein
MEAIMPANSNNKRATFLAYYEQVSLRYAIQWAKYQRLSLTVVQLWIASFDPAVKAARVEAHYMMSNDIQDNTTVE